VYSTKSGSELVLRHKRDTVSSTLDPDTLPLPSEKVVPGPSPGDEAYRKPVRISRRPGEAMKNPWPVIKRARAAKAAPWKPRTSQYRPSVPSYFEGYIELAPQLQDRLERRHERETPSPYHSPSWMWQFDLLWLLAILVYGVGDIVTSNMAFSVGATELNPFLYPLINDSVWSFVKFKAMVLIALMLISTWLITIDSDARVVPLFTLAVGLFLIANNLIVMGRLQGWI